MFSASVQIPENVCYRFACTTESAERRAAVHRTRPRPNLYLCVSKLPLLPRQSTPRPNRPYVYTVYENRFVYQECSSSSSFVLVSSVHVARLQQMLGIEYGEVDIGHVASRVEHSRGGQIEGRRNLKSGGGGGGEGEVVTHTHT